MWHARIACLEQARCLFHNKYGRGIMWHGRPACDIEAALIFLFLLAKPHTTE